VAINGPDATMFVVGTQPSTPVTPSGNTTFTITFTPSSAGLKNANVSIESDDTDENPYVISISGMGIVPDMNVKQGIANIPSGSGSHDFGAVQSGTSGTPVTFMVENLGLADLLLTGSPRVVIGGADASMFTVGTQPASPVAAAGSTTFAITFTPTSPGAKSAQVTIANDDPDENPYTFALIGEGGTNPEINVFQGSTNLLSGGNYDFGSVLGGASSPEITFTVENLGTTDLHLTGTPRVVISGPDAAMFVVGTQPATPVTPSGNTPFTITFTPASLGAKTATVTIASDDADENPYVFSLTGTGVAPDINLRQGSTGLPDGTGSYGFGSLLVGSSSAAITFTVDNLGTSNLNLTGTPMAAISGADAAMFVVSTQPATPVLPSGSTTFTITFTPADLGAKTATVTIASDDPDENPYTFDLTGTGTAPEINLRQGSTYLPDGTGSFDFGSLLVGSSSTAITFTVDNLGTSALHLTGTPIVTIGGTDAAMFVVGTQPATPVAASGTSTFAVTFTPATLGAKTATVTIANDDADESPYTFDLTGIGVGPEINVSQGSTDLPNGTGSYDFGTQAVGSSSIEVVFTIENLGTMALDLGGTPIVAIGGTNPTMFTVVSEPVSPIVPAGYAVFTIVFSPSSLGAKKATISIASNDADENPYTFEVKGRGT
jgi:hypothetical protein